MLKKLCPPVIPEAYFDGTDILCKLKNLGNSGIRYEVRDCSLGLGLPVIGLYMINADGEELFHLGADPCPITALERCVTEIFQGMDRVSEAEFHDWNEESNDPAFWKYQLQMTSWGGNIYPKELSSSNFSWTFEGFTHPVSISNEEDLEYYLGIVSSIGKRLYIRDCSYTSFNSYFCYIPSLSGVDFSYDEGEELAEYLRYCTELRDSKNLGRLGKDRVRLFAETYKEFLYKYWYCEYEHYQERFFPKGNFPMRDKGLDFILALICASAGMNEDAAEAMENYMACFAETADECDYAEDFIIRMRTGEETEEEFLKDFPNCPECGKCGTAHLCREKNMKEFQKSVFLRIKS